MPIGAFAQDSIRGVVYGIMEGKTETLGFAAIGWVGEKEVVSADVNGKFVLPKSRKSNKIFASYIGFRNDTILITNQKTIAFKLKEGEIRTKVL